MKSYTQQHPLELKIAKLIGGYRCFEPSNQPLMFGEVQMLPDDVIGRLQKAQFAFEEVRRLHAEREAAIAVRDAMLPGLKVFHDQAIEVAHRHFGANPRKMATFGVTRAAKPKPRSRRCARENGVEAVTTVIEEVITTCSVPGCGGREARCGCSKAKPPERVATPPCREPKRRRPQRRC